MLLMSSVLNPIEENCINVVRILAKQLHVRTTSFGVRKLKDHPTYPSLESVSDILNDWNIENTGLKIQPEMFLELPTPFIAQITDKNKEVSFVVVKEFDTNKAIISAEVTKRWKTVTASDFLQQTTGFVLVTDANDNAIEKDYIKNRKIQRFETLVKSLAISVVFLSCVFAAVRSFQADILMGWIFVGLTGLKLFGCYISALLLWYQIDQNNPNLQRVCRGTQKVNCGAVLNSKAAKIFGLSWSEIGFIYFAGGLITLLVSSVTYISLFFISWLTIIALPYTVFSIYYQWRIARQWCVLCLTVQGILVAEFLVSFLGGLHGFAPFSDISTNYLFMAGLCFALPALFWFLVKPSLLAAKENKLNKRALTKLKYDPEVFNILWQNQKFIDHATDGMGIVLGPPNAKNKIVKVCHPYCSHCSVAHSDLDELLRNNNDLQIQIIFMLNSADELSAMPVKHLLAINKKRDTKLTKRALDDWYLTKEKNYKTFADKYPLNGELKDQDEEIDAMSKWCNQTQIYFTPSIFINSHLLPNNYNLNDLKYFLAG